MLNLSFTFKQKKYPESNATELAQQYDSVLASLRDIVDVWSTWHGDPTALNRSRLTQQVHLCNGQMSTANSGHYSEIIPEHW